MRRILLVSTMALALAAAATPARAGEQPAIGMKPGERHPDFSLPRVDGTRGRLSDYLGRKVLLFHFASW